MEQIKFTEEADHCGSARARGRSEDRRSGTQARHLGSDAVQLEGQILWVSDAKRRSSEEENRKLKKLLAESMLDQAALKELLTKKW
jgi:hypothetical protein